MKQELSWRQEMGRWLGGGQPGDSEVEMEEDQRLSRATSKSGDPLLGNY